MPVSESMWRLASAIQARLFCNTCALFQFLSCGRFEIDLATYAIQNSFATYIDTLRGIVQHKCPRCSQAYCLACGEGISANSAQQAQRNFPGAPGAAHALFHCANLQGVILGIGLHMIEQLFQEQHRSPEDAVAAGTDGASKKRKVSPAAGMAQTAMGYEDEDEYLSSDMGRGKKAKAGTGYAGLGKEDVSGLVLHKGFYD